MMRGRPPDGSRDLKNRSLGWAEAFAIFGRYRDEVEVGAEHDEVGVWVPEAEVSDGDRQRLKELGWEPDEDGQCFWRYVT